MSPDVGHSFSNNITYYSTNLLIKRYKVKVARGAIRKSAIIVII